MSWMCPLLVKQSNSWIFDIGLIGMTVIENNSMEELQWPERLERSMVTMRIGNEIKGLL